MKGGREKIQLTSLLQVGLLLRLMSQFMVNSHSSKTPKLPACTVWATFVCLYMLYVIPLFVSW